MFCRFFGIGGYGFGGFSIIMMVALLLILFAIVYFAYSKSVQNRNYVPVRAETSSEAIRILNERFARGEISEAEYRSIRDQLLK